jgi:hypothetical protein
MTQHVDMKAFCSIAMAGLIVAIFHDGFSLVASAFAKWPQMIDVLHQAAQVIK